MSEPPLCVVERWPPLAPESGGDRDRDRDRPGPNSQRRCPAPHPFMWKWPGLTHGGRAEGWASPVTGGDTDTPAPLGVPVPGAASPAARSGQGSGSPSSACALHLSPASGSGSSPPPPGASSSRPSSPPLPSPAEHAQPGTRIAGSEAGGRDPVPRQPLPPEPPAAPPHRLPLPPPDFSLLPRMRRPTRRLALSLLGVLWLAALLLFFFGARRKLEAAEPEGHTPEVRKGRRGRGCSGGTSARCRRRLGKKFPAVFGTPHPIAFPFKFGTGPVAVRGEHWGAFRTPRSRLPTSSPSARSRTAAAPAVLPPRFTGGCGRRDCPGRRCCRRYRPFVPPLTWNIPGCRPWGAGEPVRPKETKGVVCVTSGGPATPFPRGSRRAPELCPKGEGFDPVRAESRALGADLHGPCLAYAGWASLVKARGLFASGRDGRAGCSLDAAAPGAPAGPGGGCLCNLAFPCRL